MDTVQRVVVDLRGKTLDEVTEIVSELGFGRGIQLDETESCRFLNPDTCSVFCIWLERMVEGVSFIIWDGRECIPEHGQVLYLFDPDGDAEWGMAIALKMPRVPMEKR